MSNERADVIRGFRELADFLEQHPEIPALTYPVLNVFVRAKTDLEPIARASSWQKIYSDNWFFLRKVFSGDLTLDICIEREQVCRKVVTGQKFVEAKPAQDAHYQDEIAWVCDEASVFSQVDHAER